MVAVGAGNTGIDRFRYRLGDAADIGIDARQAVTAGAFDTGHASVQAVGDAQHVLAHLFDGAGRTLFRVFDTFVERLDGLFDRLAGAGLQGVQQFLTRILDAARQVGRQAGQRPDRFGIADVAAFFGVVQAAFQEFECLFEITDGAGGLGLGGFEALGHLGDDLVDHALGGAFRIAQLDLGQTVRQTNDVFAHVLDGLAHADVAFVQLVGQLAERTFDGADGFDRLGRLHLGFDLGDAFAFLAQMARQALQALGLGVDQAFSLFDAAGDGLLIFFGAA